VVFLARHTGWGHGAILNLDVDDFFLYLEAAAEFYKKEQEMEIEMRKKIPVPVFLVKVKK